MQLADAIRKRIKHLLRENHMRPYDLCKASGIAPAVLSEFMNNHTKNLRVDTLLHLCEGFNVTLEQFFSDNLFKDVYSE